MRNTTSQKFKSITAALLALGMLSLILLSTRATRATAGGEEQWGTDTYADFLENSTLNGVDVWTALGSARLDHRWWMNAKVDDANDALVPALTFALTGTTKTETVFLAVWQDEHNCDHCGDIYMARSTTGGRTWSTNVKLCDDCDPCHEPYPECPCPREPEVAVRAADESLWVVWWADWSDESSNPARDDGNIYYLSSHNWDGPLASITTVTGTVYAGAGKQHRPNITAQGLSGYLYTLWEDERDDDGDIYAARYNPDADAAWSTPVKVNNDATTVEQSKPQVTVDADGHLYAVWEDRREESDEDDPESDVYFSRWISGTTWSAASWSANTRLSDATVMWAGEPDVVVGSDGTVYAAWVEKVDTCSGIGCSWDYQIVVGRSDDGGGTWDRTVVHRLWDASADLDEYRDPALDVDRQGRLYLAWIYYSGTSHSESDVRFSLSPDGGVHWTEPAIINTPRQVVDNDAPVALVADFDGRVVAAWEDWRAGGGSSNVFATGYPADNYLSAGSYVRTLDPGAQVRWGTISWTATISPNTGLQLATRVMTGTDAGWTDWVVHRASGESLPHPDGRQLQYRATFTSSAPPAPNDTAVLEEVVISYQSSARVYLPLVIR
jgi:hypothetical protein